MPDLIADWIGPAIRNELSRRRASNPDPMGWVDDRRPFPDETRPRRRQVRIAAAALRPPARHLDRCRSRSSGWLGGCGRLGRLGVRTAARLRHRVKGRRLQRSFLPVRRAAEGHLVGGGQLVAALPAAVQKCLAWFPGVDRTVTGYEGLIAAQQCLPDNATRDRFAADYRLPRAPLGSDLPRPEFSDACGIHPGRSYTIGVYAVPMPGREPEAARAAGWRR